MYVEKILRCGTSTLKAQRPESITRYSLPKKMNKRHTLFVEKRQCLTNLVLVKLETHTLKVPLFFSLSLSRSFSAFQIHTTYIHNSLFMSVLWEKVILFISPWKDWARTKR